MSIGYSTQRGLSNSSPMRRWSQMTSYTTPPAPPITNPTIGMTARGSAQTSTTQVKFGTASMIASGTGGSSYIENTSGDYAWWPSGTGDFTVQWWQWIPTGTTNSYMEFASNETVGGFGFRLGPSYGASNFNAIGLFARSSADLDYFNKTWTLDTWQFVSITRASATMYVHVDGISISKSGQGSGTAATYNFTVTPSVNKIQIGNAGSGGLRNVYIDDFQVFAGTAKYSASNYTPPTSQAVLTTGTTALFNMNGSNGGTSFPNVTS